MIYCVRGEDLHSWLRDHGFDMVGSSPPFDVWQNAAGEQVVLRQPNHRGLIPEMLVDSAFDAAGMSPPKLDVQWCD